MKSPCRKLLAVVMSTVMLACGIARSMTLHVGSEGLDLVPSAAVWKFLRGRQPASAPADAWQQVDFDDSGWETGPAGFGYGDDDDATVLSDMRGRYATVLSGARGISVPTPSLWMRPGATCTCGPARPRWMQPAPRRPRTLTATAIRVPTAGPPTWAPTSLRRDRSS
jgi:hypothetical protein